MTFKNVKLCVYLCERETEGNRQREFIVRSTVRHIKFGFPAIFLLQNSFHFPSNNLSHRGDHLKC